MLVLVEQAALAQMGDVFPKTQRGQTKTGHSLMGQEQELLCTMEPRSTVFITLQGKAL